ncbi:MAG: gamma-glutamyltransferase [Gemmatimonadaceae bacterium]
MSIAFIATLLLQVANPDTATLRGARSPAYASDGRLAISVEGDILLQLTPGGTLKRVTTGLPWDRDPAWTSDGSAIVFASDRGGNYDLWRVTVAKDGTAGTPERITNTPVAETSPSIAADGTMAFLRGSGNGTRIWIRGADGAEKRLNTRDQTEGSPRFSPDGLKLAYIATVDGTRRVIVRTMKSGAEQTANSDKNADRVAWSPQGDRVAISARAGIFVVPTDGRWTNFASVRHGDIAWSPTTNQFAIAEFDEVNVAYNGDPDRTGDRASTENFDSKDHFYFTAAPAAPDIGMAEQKLASTVDRATRNADAYDRVWERSTKLYFSQPDAAARRVQWDAVKARHRAAAIAAKDDDELQRAIYAMLQERPPLRSSASGRAAISSAHPVATEAGLVMLRKGGNVVDAAVAVSFALGVVEPDASGVGGYGEMVIAMSNLEKPTLFEFMTRVPEDAGLSNTSLLVNGRYPSDGPALTNVPGTTAGMYAAWKKYGSGKIPWKDLLAPAIAAARGGYVVSEGLATTLATEHDAFAKYESSKALFFRDGRPVVAGDTIKNVDLAWTLEQIAAKGADGFYKGDVAKKWIDDIHPKGNAMKLTDLARYYAPEREAVSGTYRGFTLWSSAPPVSGGAELVARMNLFEQYPKPINYTNDATTLNAALSAWFLVPSTRNRVADPGLWSVDIEPITNRDTAKVRWACFHADKALRPADVRGDTLACLKAAKSATGASDKLPNELASMKPQSPCGDDHAVEVSQCRSAGTTAFTVADNEGNVVAVTQTLGTWGGNFYVAPGLGFLSNDKLTSYGTDPTQYGSRLPFARHGSTLAPTIVFKGKKPVFAVGAAGNAWITSAVYESLIGALDFGLNPQQALELPRFLPGGGFGGGGGGRGGAGGGGSAPVSPPYNIQLEDGFSPDVIKKIRAMGYDITFVSMRGELREGYGAAVSIDGKTVMAGADPRRAGAAGAVQK